MNLDVRRLWECPTCGRQRKLAGDVVSQFCRCSGESGSEGAWMRLVEPKRTVRVDRPRTVHELSCEEIAPDAVPEQETVPQAAEGSEQSPAEAAREEERLSGSPEGSTAGELPRED